MPSPEYFPFASLSAETLVPDSYALTLDPSSEPGLSWFWRLFSSKTEKTEHLLIPKYANGASTDVVSLEVALQYGAAKALVPLQNFMRDFTAKVYQPAYADFTTLVHAGNTDGESSSAVFSLKGHLLTRGCCALIRMGEMCADFMQPWRDVHYGGVDVSVSAFFCRTLRCIARPREDRWRGHARRRFAKGLVRVG